MLVAACSDSPVVVPAVGKKENIAEGALTHAFNEVLLGLRPNTAPILIKWNDVKGALAAVMKGYLSVGANWQGAWHKRLLGCVLTSIKVRYSIAFDDRDTNPNNNKELGLCCDQRCIAKKESFKVA
jgi:hypothetical protein